MAPPLTMAVMSTRTPSRPTRRRLAAVAVVVGAGLLLPVLGCSSGDDRTSTPTSAPAVTAALATAPPARSAPTTSVAATTSAAPTTTTPPADARQELLRGILESHRAAGEFVGARIALREPDGTVTEVTDGTTTVDPASAPVDPDTAWNIGSVTKSFVAVVVLQLADEGRIDLDAGIDAFVPDLAGADRITPRQLLQHTSGLGEYNDKPALLEDQRRPWTPAELIAVAEAGGRVGEPGGAHHYANTNYIVLGEIIEQVTGHPWADEVRSRIVEPLGLTHTGLISEQRPVGYKVVDGAFVDATDSADPSTGGAAGQLQSTDHDLLLFVRALADGTLVSPASQAAMQAFVPGEDYSQFGIDHGYGLGIERYANDAIAVIGHMGTGEAQSAFVGYDPAHGTTVSVMTNTAVAGPQAFMAFEALVAAAGTATPAS
jgi:D-alanyl-D-alanine carboxypeptidase